ncbi:hypothetical protein K458DRAFT_293788 [Lentithecium fluviatile CBS 122367]|uniref:Uncharacterized protein n=1 Tax=Lentithecium fluviatile CBS 122367 TaxID=1168545 RepID=A0A6G1JCZ9_9PLEO|nr:hypothetical protein K458DRAFT_293788 [Lentithecium fluviatile CBS 122367]
MCNATADLLPPSITTYIQINTVFAADGSVDVDVATTRPWQQYNSYEKLVEDKTFTVAELANGEELSVQLSENEGLKFKFGDRKWTLQDRTVEEGRAWCEVGQWTGGEEWECDTGKDRRNRRNLTCGFPCARQENAELR